MEEQVALHYLHRHYVAWLLQGQWQPELSLPVGCYPVMGEWIRLDWQFSEPVPDECRNKLEQIVERCFTNVCEVWTVCQNKKVSALTMAKTLSTPEKCVGLWVAATEVAEEILRECEVSAACQISNVCGSYQSLADTVMMDINAWWTMHSEMPPSERREHRKRIQNYLKKAQYGHISGYVARRLKNRDDRNNAFWFWIPLVMESLWLQKKPSMSLLTKHLDFAHMAAEGENAFFVWVRETCAELKRMASPEDPVMRVMESISKDCSLPFSQKNLAEGLGLTPAYFSRLFEKRTGMKFTEYLTQARITHARELLHGGVALTEVAQASGFQRKSYFCEVFRKQTGMTTMEYRAMMKKGDTV